MLRCENLHAGYPNHPVLHGLDLAVGDGERVAILGRNGVGKTTLIRAITGSIPVREGTITLDGAPVHRLRPHRRVALGVSHVPQGRDIFPRLTVADNLKVAAVARSSRDWAARVDTALEAFPVLAQKRDALGSSLSGGQQQLLAIARALLTEPRILLLDEPSEGIQPSALDAIVGIVLAANTERGVAIVIVEQNLEFAARLAEQAYVVEKGQISAQLPTEALRSSRALQRQYLAV